MRILLAVLLFPAITAAQELTLEQALERAKNRAPSILAAQERINEARGRLKGASLVFQKNPEVDFNVGRRTESGRTDFQVGAMQSFEPGRRSARVQGATAEVDAVSAESDNVVRLLLADVARAYLRAAAAQQKVDLLKSSDEIATAFERSMQRRLDLGDVPALDVNLARTASARTRAVTNSARADLISALGDLRVFLGMTASEPLAISPTVAWNRDFSETTLLAKALSRPDIRALTAELRQAEAQVRLGKSEALTELSAGVRYEREDGDNVPKAAVTFTIPLFNRGQENIAVGSSRATRIRQQIEASRRVVESEISSALQQYAVLRLSAEDLQKNGVPVLKDNETLSTRSYEEGEISLIELLLIRRESLEIQTLVVEKQLEAALAAVEVEYRSGAFQ